MRKAMTLAQFVAKAQAVHGLGKYDYSAAEYTKYQAHITIVCREHGPFNQFAHRHLQGAGCAPCAKASHAAQLHAAKRDVFIQRCQAIHPDYDFSQTIYTGSGHQVTVQCPTHGAFSTKASSLLAGHRCLRCAQLGNNKGVGWSKTAWVGIQRGRKAILYVLEAKAEGELFFKLGITYDLSGRYSGKAIPYQTKEVARYESESPAEIWDLEHEIHRRLKSLRHKPKTPFGGQTECFTDLNAILAIFPL